MPAWPLSAHVGWLFQERPLRERVDAAARAGFTAIEHPAPYAVPAPEMVTLLDAAGVRFTQLAVPSGDAAAGEKGLGIFPERRAEVRAGVAAALDYAEAVGARMVHAMAGVLPEAARRSEHWECYVEHLADVAAQAAPRGIAVVVEAMCPQAVPDYFLATPQDARRAIDACGAPNAGLLLDVFHCAGAGFDPAQEIAAHRDRIAHVHLADHPGRHEPGTGTIDFSRVAAALGAAGYAGALGCEYAPAQGTEAGLAWMRDGALAA